MAEIIKIGTRASPLAVAQAKLVGQLLLSNVSSSLVQYQLVEIVSSGDRLLSDTLRDAGGKGLFTKELDQALLDGRIDIAVHSFKDVETSLPDGLEIAAVPPRDDARDVWISSFADIASLPKHACFGTASLRRQSQILCQRPDIKVSLLRGNVQTRLQKLKNGAADATILAAAGLNRLGYKQENYIKLGAKALSIHAHVPAVGQGALAIVKAQGQLPAKKGWLEDALRQTHDHSTWLCVEAERAMLAALDGSCHTPIGGYSWIEGSFLKLRGFLGKEDGSKACFWNEEIEISHNIENATSYAIQLGRSTAHQLQIQYS